MVCQVRFSLVCIQEGRLLADKKFLEEGSNRVRISGKLDE